MKSHTTRFRTLKAVLFCVAIGLIFVGPISAFAWMLAARQESAVTAEQVALSETVTYWKQRQNQRDASGLRGPTQAAELVPAVSQTTWAPRTLNPNLRTSQDSIQRYAKKIKRARNEDDRQEAIDQARAALEKHYDRYIDSYREQIDELEERLDQLQAQLKKREDAKDRLIESRMEMILDEADGVGWPESTDRRPTLSRNPLGTTMLPEPFPPLVASSPRAVASSPVPVPSSGTTKSLVPGPVVSGPKAVPLPTTPYLAETKPSRLAAPPTAVRPTPGMTIRTPVDIGPRGVATRALSLPPRRGFQTYFKQAVKLLKDEQYGEFLDRYLPPKQFRKLLRTSTLEEVENDFESNLSKRLLTLFESADWDKAEYDPERDELVWEVKLDSDDEETAELVLYRGDDNQWYLLLQNDELLNADK